MTKLDRLEQKNDFDLERQIKSHAKGIERKKLRAERKKFKRNQQPKEPRRKDWTPDRWEDADTAEIERIMPRDEGERRSRLERAAYARTADHTPGNGLVPRDNGGEATILGRVIEMASGLCRVAVAGEILLCTGRGILHAQESGYTNALAVGDQVVVRRSTAGHGVVEAVLPRRSLLARPDVFYSHLQQVVVANVDQLLVVASWREPLIWYELIDRYLVAAAHNRLPAVLCINKLDLATSAAEVEQAVQPYRRLGIACIFTSAETGDGIAALRAAMQGRTTVLAGLSGVGKSSLLAAVQPGLHLRIGEVSERKHEGRHTTTQATLIPLDNTTWVVDTPGIREFGLSGVTRAQLIAYFPDMVEAAGACRFRNCTHLDELDCAVQAGVASGGIAASRYHSYCEIYGSLPA